MRIEPQNQKHNKNQQDSGCRSRKAFAAIMMAGTIAIGNGNIAFAGKGNEGISVPTDTQQKQECQTAGGTSPVSDSCTASSLNTISQLGGLLRELQK
jgi:hypothetical protein